MNSLAHFKDIGLNIVKSPGYTVSKSVGSCAATASPGKKAAAAPPPPVAKNAPPRQKRSGPCITRFAPSPTGYLHIGGARTAMFCYLYARHNKGQFKLRIEDTDAERNDESAVNAIIQGMQWLGCPHDGEIVRQSKMCARHQFIITKRPIAVEENANKNLTSDAAKEVLNMLAELVKKYKGDWTPEALEPVIKGLAEEKKMKLGDVAKPARAALTGSMHSPGLFEVIWVLGKDEAVGRFTDAAKGLCTIRVEKKEEPPAPEPAAEKKTVSTAPIVISGNVEEQITQVGDEIRILKTKLKADGLSGKKIDVNDDVKALVAKLVALKSAAAAAPKAATSPKNSPKTSPKAAPKGSPKQAPAGNVEEQIKQVGDDIRALKTKLKETGLSGKKIDKNDEVIALVAKLQELKSAQ